MRVIVTAGPTREYIDPVRFITNGSSGAMGYAVVAAAAAAGHEVTLLSGPVCASMRATAPAAATVVDFVTVDELAEELSARFPHCDALVMAAAVGDFRPKRQCPDKLRRADGPLTLQLVPTEDILASLKPRRRGQLVIAFAVEDGPPERLEAKARAEMAAKGSNFTVVNTPAAMAAAQSAACILSPGGVVLPWDTRPKEDLARHIVGLMERGK
jgi:phosphopantothenoylcysteine decarboxylase/phosphopantothenate--cysteine ligase